MVQATLEQAIRAAQQGGKDLLVTIPVTAQLVVPVVLCGHDTDTLHIRGSLVDLDVEGEAWELSMLPLITRTRPFQGGKRVGVDASEVIVTLGEAEVDVPCPAERVLRQGRKLTATREEADAWRRGAATEIHEIEDQLTALKLAFDERTAHHFLVEDDRQHGWEDALDPVAWLAEASRTYFRPGVYGVEENPTPVGLVLGWEVSSPWIRLGKVSQARVKVTWNRTMGTSPHLSEIEVVGDYAAEAVFPHRGSRTEEANAVLAARVGETYHRSARQLAEDIVRGQLDELAALMSR